DRNRFQYPVSRAGDPVRGGLAARAHDERRRLTMANKLADWLEALTDPDDATREEAAQALIKLADPSATDGLIEALQDDYWSVRTIAAEALGRIGDPKAIKGLMALFKDTSKLVRVAATIALTQIGELTVEPLIEGLKDENFQVRLHSVQALGGITSDYPTGRSWLRDSRPVPGLIACLKDKDRAVREDAAIALGMIGDPSAVPALIEALKDGQVKVRAIMALGMIADTRAVEPLIEILQGIGIYQKGTPTPGCIVSEEWFVREEAAKALGHFNDTRSVPALLL